MDDDSKTYLSGIISAHITKLRRREASAVLETKWLAKHGLQQTGEIVTALGLDYEKLFAVPETDEA